MAHEIPLTLQTAYAELLELTQAAAFTEAFPPAGTFVSKVQRGRRYWYFQNPAMSGRAQRYVGPETPALLDRIAAHRHASAQQRDRRGLVAMLVRGGNLPRPVPAIGNIVEALARAGVFRLRGILVGTIAYQTYGIMLGCRLPAALVQTNDIDIAQFANVSVAIGDTTSPLLDVLRQADPGFRPVPHIVPDSVVSLMAGSGVRVDFLTPNRGRDPEVPVHLPALGVDAQPLRFLDFLITEPEPAVLLHGAGVLVSVPSPARFAVHKLILSRRRRPGDAKQRKDLMQAESLLRELAARDALGLQAIWHEAAGRGKTWNRLLVDGLGGIDQTVANSVRLCVGIR